MSMRLCSACLLGVRCRYDEKSRPSRKVIKLFRNEILIPVCPEQLGGLPTPREPSERRGKIVKTKSGRDVTKNFKTGSEEVLRLAESFRIKGAIFRQRSAACGCGQIYDGTFTGRVVKGDGVTAELLKRNGIKIITEQEL